MITAGIIAEYNPFHKGHQYHIEETRKKTKADYVIVAMSGDFVQRGEPAIADKYFRTGLALRGGADVVMEIPAVYATASAEYFATAGVKLLHKLGCVDYLSFGSEWASIEDYEPYVQFLTEESYEYQNLLKEGLRQGKRFPLARMDALSQLMTGGEKEREQITEFLSEPNHILGLEYLKCLKRLNSSVVPVTVKREGAGYHEKKLGQEYPSATALRQQLKENPQCHELESGMNLGAKKLMEQYSGGDFVEWDDLMPYLEYHYLTERSIQQYSDSGKIDGYFGMDDEMYRRFFRYYKPGTSFDETMEQLHTKRLTDAALRRGLLHMILSMKKYHFLENAAEIPVPYCRILGFSKKATPLLKQIRQNAELAIIQKPALGRKLCPEGTDAGTLFEMDILASDFYETIASRKSGRKFQSEMTRSQVIQ